MCEAVSFCCLCCYLKVLPSLFCVCSSGLAMFSGTFQKVVIVLRLFEHPILILVVRI